MNGIRVHVGADAVGVLVDERDAVGVLVDAELMFLFMLPCSLMLPDHALMLVVNVPALAFYIFQ